MLRACVATSSRPLAGVGKCATRITGIGLSSIACRRNVSTTTPIEASRVQVELTREPKPKPEPSSLKFGKSFTDHMLTIPWNHLTGWGTPLIHPYRPIPLDPAAGVLHFAYCLFEGFKAYRNPDGNVSIFRPDMNMKRMNTSAERATLPTFNGNAVIELIKQLVRMEKDWVPSEPGYSLYIRPYLIGTEPTLMVLPPTDALLLVILSPVGPYYPAGFKPVALYGTTEYIRAAPGGIGAYKLGANYMQGLAAQRHAAKQGYVQNLWLHGPEHLITEVGSMNAMAVFQHPGGVTELATAPLDGMILPGITRDSVLSLARDHASGKSKIPGLPDKLTVTERAIPMKEVKDAAKNGTLVEFFGTGTAAVISPVDKIGYLGEDVHIPIGPDGMGPVSHPLWKQLVDIQTGVVPHPWSVKV